MTTTPTLRRRTIQMPEHRSRQLACAAAYLNTDAETCIQAAISAFLLSLASNDAVFAAVMARSGGVTWQMVAQATHADILAVLQP